MPVSVKKYSTLRSNCLQGPKLHGVCHGLRLLFGLAAVWASLNPALANGNSSDHTHSDDSFTANLDLFHQHPILVSSVIALLILQSVAVILLVKTHNRHKKTEQTLRATEQKFRDFARSSSDWFWEMDDQLRIQSISGQYRSITGLDESEIIGKRREELTSEDLISQDWKQHLQDLKAHKPVRGFVYSRPGPDGDPVWIRTNGIPIHDEAGRFLGYRGTASDITEQRRIEALRDKALLDAQRANQAKSEFLAMMSHELRTPLNAIIGFSELIRLEQFGPIGNNAYKDYAEDIHVSGTHLLELINDILDISAIEAGKRDTIPEEVDLNQVLEDCRRNLEKVIAQKDLTMSFDVMATDTPLIADKRAMFQILLNLLSNATKFTERGDKIDAKASIQGKDWVISVEDTGIGIDKKYLPTITQPFQQARSHAHVSHTGSGLGLVIVAALVRANEGTFGIQSEKGVGSKVTITIPVSDQAPSK